MVWGDWTNAAKEQKAHIEARKVMTELTGAGGGFIVPPVILNQLIELLRAKAVVRKMGPTVISNLASNTLEVPKQTAAAIGYWVAESALKTPSDPAFAMLEMVLKEVAAMTIIPNALIEDSTPTADVIVKNDLATAIALAEDSAFIQGTGGPMPLGILNWPGIGVTNLLAGIVYNDLLNAMSAIEVQNGSYSGWLMHPRSKNTLRQITDLIGRYIWIPSLVVTEPDSLFGLPCFYSTQVPTNLVTGALINTSPIVLGNWPDFLIVEKRTGITLDISKESGETFRRNQTSFRAVKRVDCGVRQTACFHIIHGVQ